MNSVNDFRRRIKARIFRVPLRENSLVHRHGDCDDCRTTEHDIPNEKKQKKHSVFPCFRHRDDRGQLRRRTQVPGDRAARAGPENDVQPRALSRDHFHRDGLRLAPAPELVPDGTFVRTTISVDCVFTVIII